MSEPNAQKPNTFFIDDREIDIREGESIFRAARRLDIKLPHLCYTPKPGYVGPDSFVYTRGATSDPRHPSQRRVLMKINVKA